MKKKIMISIGILVSLWLIASLVAMTLNGRTPEKSGNIAVIPINGMIMVGSSDSIYGDGSASSEVIVGYIKEASEDPNVKAILLDINSGGGSPVATDEIAEALKNTNKTKVAVIREVGASGAYWVATTADRIFANRMSMTGSIGVRASYLDFSGLINRYNVSYEQIIAGDYKDMGTPFRELTDDERAIFKDLVDDMHDFFIDAVSENRGMSREAVTKIADGRVFLGSKALELGLVDELGTKDDAIRYIESELNITADLFEYNSELSILDVLGAISYSDNNFKIAKYIKPVSQDLPRIS